MSNCPGAHAQEPPRVLSDAVLEHLRGWRWVPRDAAAGLPADRGAYLLVLRLRRPRRIVVGALGRRRFEAGWYLYAGSARGPGGLAARVGRHLRGGARVRWHVDHLRRAMEAPGAWVRAGGDSCVAIAAIRDAGAGSAVPGIGASDCPGCDTHLIRL